MTIDITNTLIGTDAAETLNGGAGEDLVVGLGGSDTIDGGSGNDTLLGGDGDDTLTGGAGDDDLYGDTGTDTAVLSGNQADYLVTDLGNGVFEVTDQRGASPDGADTLRGIENLAFADGTISLLANAAPTDIALSHDTIAENSAVGALVGALSTTDPDAGDTFTYQLLDDAGGRFALDGNLLEVAGALDFETAASHQVTVRVTDSGGLSHDETFTIGVTDVAESVPFAASSDLALINRFNVSDNATLALARATSAATAVVDGVTYLFAAGGADNGVSVFAVGVDGSLANVATIFDDATLQLGGARSLTVAEAGGVTYLIAAGFLDSGLSVFRVETGGSLTNTSNVAYDGTPGQFATSSVTTAVVDGETYVFAAAAEGGVGVFSLGADGSLTAVASLFDDATLALDGAISVSTAVVDGVTYLFVAGLSDNGVSVLAVGAGGSLTNVANVFDDIVFGDVESGGTGGDITVGGNIVDLGSLNLFQVNSVTTAVVDGNTYLFTAASDGLGVFRVDAGGPLTYVENVGDTPARNLHFANNLSTAVVGGITYLFVAAGGQDDSGVSAFAVAADGQLTNVANVAVGNGGAPALGVQALTTAEVGGTTYLFAGGFADDGISVFELASDDTAGGPNAAPTDIALSHDTIAENSAAGALVGVLTTSDPDASDTFTYQLVDDAGGRFALDGNLLEVAGALDFEIATSHQVTVRVTDSGGLSHDETFTIAVNDMAESPINGAPAIASNGGGDNAAVSIAENSTAVITVGANDPDPGTDIDYSIVGGADAARFQIDAVTGALSFVTAPDFEAPSDADGDNRYVVQVRASDGSLFDDQTITVTATDVLGLSLSGDGGDNRLVGSSENDTLRGLGGNDRLVGGRGADTLNGGAGTDTADYLGDGPVTVDLAAGTAITSSGVDTLISIERVIGSPSNDTLRGNTGDNVLDGASGDDVIYGFAGHDRLEGGAGNDHLFGGNGDDEVIGQSGNDRLDGGNGNDLVRGDDGNDVLEGRDGNDRLEGGAGDDTIDAGAGNDLIFGGDGNDRLFAMGRTDILTGGAGNDLFFYTNETPGLMAGDTITDFESVAGQNTGDSLVIHAGFSNIAFNNGSTAIAYNGVTETIFHPGVQLSLANDILVM